jgi:3-hydroxyacyl-CoA dehydrogenase
MGLPMRPLQLLGMVGPAVALHVGETLHAAFPDRFGVSANLARMVAAGKTGFVDRDGGIDPSPSESNASTPSHSVGDANDSSTTCSHHAAKLRS